MSFVSSLNETPYALTFAGQATPWRAALDEIAHDPEIAAIVAGVIEASDKVLSPVRRSLATQSVSVLPFTLPAPDGEVAVTREVAGPDEAALSVPGIVAAQLGALIDLTRAGLNIVANQPTAFEGHSQGVLGVEIARAWIDGDEARAASVFALARLIGAAAARITRPSRRRRDLYGVRARRVRRAPRTHHRVPAVDLASPLDRSAQRHRHARCIGCPERPGIPGCGH